MPNYRKSPEAAWPLAAYDCVDAYRWMVEDKKIPPHRIVLAGTCTRVQCMNSGYVTSGLDVMMRDAGRR